MLPALQLGQGRSKRGYTLLELIITVAIVCMILSMVMANYKIRVDKAKLERTVKEMTAIAQASQDYYNSQGSWPADPSVLSPPVSQRTAANYYMYAPVVFSPFGSKYQINGLNNTVTVSTTVPGMPNDTISITQGLPNESTGKLKYENKYVYQR